MSKKYTLEELKKCAHECATYKLMAKQLGVSTATANKWCHLAGIKPNKHARYKGTGANADRHLCKTCMFRNESVRGTSCDYICYTEYPRGCPPDECNVYQKGNPEDARRIYKKQ